MAQSKTEPAQQAPPSIEDVQAIGNAAAGAAQTEVNESGDANAAGEAAAAAAAAEAEARNITLPKEVIDQIARASAAATVTELASQRAIVPPEDETEDEDEDEDGDGQEDEHAADDPPHKPTLAEKLLKPYQKR